MTMRSNSESMYPPAAALDEDIIKITTFTIYRGYYTSRELDLKVMKGFLSFPLLALLLVAGPVWGAPAPDVGFLEPEPGFSELGAVTDPMDLPRLEMAALLASGLRPEELGPYQSRLDRIMVEAGA